MTVPSIRVTALGQPDRVLDYDAARFPRNQIEGIPHQCGDLFCTREDRPLTLA